MKNKFYLVVILILAGIIVAQRLLQPEETNLNEYIKIGGKEYLLLKNQKDTLWLPQEVIEVPKYVPVPSKTIIKEVPIDVDTLAILREYYKEYYYSNVVPLDSIGTITINDSISQNKIISRKVIFDYKIPIIKEVITVKEDQVPQLYAGGGFNIERYGSVNFIYTGLLFKTKKDKIYGVNIGVFTKGTSTSPYFGASMYWKIRFKKD